MIDSIAKRLLQAGVAHKVSATTFLAAKVLGGILGLALGAFAGGSTGTAATALMFGAAFGIRARSPLSPGMRVAPASIPGASGSFLPWPAIRGPMTSC